MTKSRPKLHITYDSIWNNKLLISDVSYFFFRMQSLHPREKSSTITRFLQSYPVEINFDQVLF